MERKQKNLMDDGRYAHPAIEVMCVQSETMFAISTEREYGEYGEVPEAVEDELYNF